MIKSEVNSTTIHTYREAATRRRSQYTYKKLYARDPMFATFARVQPQRDVLMFSPCPEQLRKT
jgi:hypothetical protein